MAITQRKLNTHKRYMKIQARYKVLYNEERKRIDDVYTTLQEEFCIGEQSINMALRYVPKIETTTQTQLF